MKKAQWKALVLAQLDARELNIKTGMSNHYADNLLVRNLQEYVRLDGLRNTYRMQKEILMGETPVTPIRRNT
jgi:hypothetical protein